MRSSAFTPVLLVLSIGLGACVPWTVRPIESEKHASEATPVSLTPAAYVDSIWSSKLVPAVTSLAVDARELLNAIAVSPGEAQRRFAHREANGPPYYIVKGRGIVSAVDSRSRVGFVLVDIAPYDQRPDLSIQIGPVLRGTSLRDATGIVRFSDFANQLQFADAGNEINGRVLKTVLAPVDRSRLKGRIVSFTGTLPAQEKSEPPLAELVPVSLTVEEPQ